MVSAEWKNAPAFAPGKVESHEIGLEPYSFAVLHLAICVAAMPLAEKIGLTTVNLSILKTGKIKAVRLSTLEAICKVLDCQPGDILEYRKE